MNCMSTTTTAMWLALGLLIGVFVVEVCRETMNAAAPTYTPPLWYATIG
jgi:hypothetical protein